MNMESIKLQIEEKDDLASDFEGSQTGPETLRGHHEPHIHVELSGWNRKRL